MKLLALILAYTISHFIAQPEKYRLFNWFKSWSQWLSGKFSFPMHELTVILIISVPVVVISSILLNVFNSTLGGLIMAIVVLSYCIGPESFEEDVEGGEIHKKLGIRKNAKESVLIKKMTQVSLKRWFGVFFWYVVLGIVGALIFRFSERLDFYTDKNNKLKPTVNKLMRILNYPVAWMMVVSLAIASDFERIFKKCKPYMSSENLTSMDTSFLYEAADFAVENCEIEANNKDTIEVVTINVLKRMMVVWLVIVAILVILAV